MSNYYVSKIACYDLGNGRCIYGRVCSPYIDNAMGSTEALLTYCRLRDPDEKCYNSYFNGSKPTPVFCGYVSADEIPENAFFMNLRDDVNCERLFRLS